MHKLMDEEHVTKVIGELADGIVSDIGPGGAATFALVGIRSRGEILAQRLAEEMQTRLPNPNERIDVGALDITMYRDDLTSRRAITIPQGTDMNFQLDGRAVILIDDVLQSGRSVRAALDALVDFGRPRLIRLAVLIDRGLREFPIAADYIGLKVDNAEPAQKIVVHLKPTDPEDAVYLTI